MSIDAFNFEIQISTYAGWVFNLIGDIDRTLFFPTVLMPIVMRHVDQSHYWHLILYQNRQFLLSISCFPVCFLYQSRFGSVFCIPFLRCSITTALIFNEIHIMRYFQQSAYGILEHRGFPCETICKSYRDSIFSTCPTYLDFSASKTSLSGLSFCGLIIFSLQFK